MLDKLRIFDDFDAVFAEITGSKELVALTPLEAYQLLSADSSLREWVDGGRFVYADGYFVLAEKQYVLLKEGELHLTAKAKKNWLNVLLISESISTLNTEMYRKT